MHLCPAMVLQATMLNMASSNQVVSEPFHSVDKAMHFLSNLIDNAVEKELPSSWVQTLTYLADVQRLECVNTKASIANCAFSV